MRFLWTIIFDASTLPNEKQEQIKWIFWLDAMAFKYYIKVITIIIIILRCASLNSFKRDLNKLDLVQKGVVTAWLWVLAEGI